MQQVIKPTNVIIDTDMGWDDIVAICLLLKNPNFKLLGITVTGCGETHLENGMQIARTLVELGHSDAVVCAGASTPSCHDNQFAPSFRAQMDSVFGLLDGLKKPVRPADPRTAWEFIQDSLTSAASPITILSLGGFTNIAKLFDISSEPNIQNIERIFIMGGAVACAGNVADLNNAAPKFNQGPVYASNVVAEWNIFLDALAAKRVFDSSIPLTLVPLDACNCVMLTKEYATYVKATDPLAGLVQQVLALKANPHGPYYEPNPVPVFDPLAAMVMAGMMPSGLRSDVVLDVEVAQTEVNNTCGWTKTVHNSSNRPIHVVNTEIAEEFEDAFKHWINAPLL